jgi:glucose-6-phosphate 1-dehydrogenase
MQRNPVAKLLLFGATGDLAQRMLLPSLYGLHADGLLPDGLTIFGSARSDLDDAAYRDFTKKALDEFLPADRKDESAMDGFLARVFYQPVDLSNRDTFPALAEKVGDVAGGLAIYLSTAPSLFEAAIAGLESVGLAGETVRIGLEKPLGYDLASSREIKDAVAVAFP